MNRDTLGLPLGFMIYLFSNGSLVTGNPKKAKDVVEIQVDETSWFTQNGCFFSPEISC